MPTMASLGSRAVVHGACCVRGTWDPVLVSSCSREQYRGPAAPPDFLFSLRGGWESETHVWAGLVLLVVSCVRTSVCIQASLASLFLQGYQSCWVGPSHDLSASYRPRPTHGHVG